MRRIIIIAAAIVFLAANMAYHIGVIVSERNYYSKILNAEIFSVDLTPDAENTRIFLAIGEDVYVYSLQLY